MEPTLREALKQVKYPPIKVIKGGVGAKNDPEKMAFYEGWNTLMTQLYKILKG